MTLDQVNQIIGCKNDVNGDFISISYVRRLWHLGTRKGIVVEFDPTTGGNIVKAPIWSPGSFKSQFGFL
jgi:hypothetical protein